VPQRRPPLTEAQVLAWADAHRARTGRWPSAQSGAIADAPGETWQAVNRALARGGRGLPGGASLAQLLGQAAAAYHGRSNRRHVLRVPDGRRWK
jgi:hypothetical protein